MDWSKTIAAIAPTLATMLGGPLAGGAVSAIESALGLSSGSGTDAIEIALQAGKLTPDAIAAMKIADQKHAEIIAQQGIDLEKLNSGHAEALASIAAQDRDSARKREVLTGDNLTPRLLATGITFGFFGVLFWLIKYGKPEAGGDVLLVMVGSLGAAFAAVVGYYFGSSASSARKDTLLHQSAPIP